jgi:hypothetical protein
MSKRYPGIACFLEVTFLPHLCYFSQGKQLDCHSTWKVLAPRRGFLGNPRLIVRRFLVEA